MPQADKVNQKQLALWLDITPKQVRNLIKAGVLSGDSDSGYPLKSNVHAYIGYLRELRTKKRPTGVVEPTTTDEHTDTHGINVDHISAMTEQTKLVKLQLGVMEQLGTVTPNALITHAIGNLARGISSALENLPTKIKRAAPEITPEALEEVDATLVTIGNELAEFEIDFSDLPTDTGAHTADTD